MDKLFTRGVGGFPLILDDLRQFFGRLDSPSHGIYQAFNNLFRGFGDDFIVQGCIVSGTTPNVAITEGWVILGGELIKVDAQAGIDTSTDNKFVKVTTFDPRGTKTFQNSTINETYEKNRAIIQGTTGNLDFDGLRINGIINATDFGGSIEFPQTTNPGSDPDIQVAVDNKAIILPSGHLFTGLLQDSEIQFMTKRPLGDVVYMRPGTNLVSSTTFKVNVSSPPDGFLPFTMNNEDGTEVDLFISKNTILKFVSFGASWVLESVGSVLLKTKKLSIGVWNMDADRSSLSVVHGLPDILKITSIDIIITKDGSVIRHPLFGTFNVLGVNKLGGSYELTSTTITGVRAEDGFFDDTSFNSITDPANRGFILITFEA